MSVTDRVDDDHEHKVDLRLWKKLLQYTLHYRRTAITFTIVSLGMAVCDLGFPLLTGSLVSDIVARGSDVDLVFYGTAFIGLTVLLCSFVWGFIACAGKIRTHVSHDIRRDAFRRLQELSFGFYDTKPVGWLMTRLTSDCQRLSKHSGLGSHGFDMGHHHDVRNQRGDAYIQLAASPGGPLCGPSLVRSERLLSQEDSAYLEARAQDKFATDGCL